MLILLDMPSHHVTVITVSSFPPIIFVYVSVLVNLAIP